MKELIIQITAAVIAALIIAKLGLSGSTKVKIENARKVRKTGKWMMFFSVIAIIAGLAWAGNNAPIQGGIDLSKSGTIYGITLACYGVLFFIMGWIVNWFQRP